MKGYTIEAAHNFVEGMKFSNTLSFFRTWWQHDYRQFHWRCHRWAGLQDTLTHPIFHCSSSGCSSCCFSLTMYCIEVQVQVVHFPWIHGKNPFSKIWDAIDESVRCQAYTSLSSSSPFTWCCCILRVFKFIFHTPHPTPPVNFDLYEGGDGWWLYFRWHWSE